LEVAHFPEVPDEEKKKLLSFVIVGGGPTGVEFAGELADFVGKELRKYYPGIEKYVKVSLVQSGDHVSCFIKFINMLVEIIYCCFVYDNCNIY
jgi:NADH:ubiquinone reductase (non-electrogenic)